MHKTVTVVLTKNNEVIVVPVLDRLQYYSHNQYGQGQWHKAHSTRYLNINQLVKVYQVTKISGCINNKSISRKLQLLQKKIILYYIFKVTSAVY